jgi:hypothetical protein
MIRRAVNGVAVTLLWLSLGGQAFGQGATGTFTGIVRDEKGRGVNGVTVSAVDADTANLTASESRFRVIHSTVTGRDGSYTLTVAPGERYAISAVKTQDRVLRVASVELVAVEANEIKTINFTLTAIRVVPPVSPITLSEPTPPPFPFEGADPLALMSTIAGYNASSRGHEYDILGGLPLRTMNTRRDGLTVSDSFSQAGFSSVTTLNPDMISTLNPDMISELRLILAPVDAEAGNGNARVQITTRSGTNRRRLGLRTSLRHATLDASGPDPARQATPFDVTFQSIVNASGPVIKNHTFYFINWDEQRRLARPDGFVATPVLTDYARNGVFRFWDGWNSGDASIPEPTAADPLGGIWPIHLDGSAVAPRFWADSVATPYDGALKCFSVFGNIKRDGSPFTAADCGTYVPNVYRGSGNPNDPANYGPDWAHPLPAVAILRDGPWDSFSRPPDRTGYIQRLLAYMPRANFYIGNTAPGGGVVSPGADGLNRAAFAWVRGQTGFDTGNTFGGNIFGSGLRLDQARVTHRVINAKIDSNLNSNLRTTVGLSFQRDWNTRVGLQSPWPDGIDGYSIRLPHIVTATALMTLAPNAVNELRFGLTRNRSTALPPWENPNNDVAALARSFLQQGWIDPASGRPTPVFYTPGVGTMDFSDNVMARGIHGGSGPCAGKPTIVAAAGNCENGSALYTLSDTLGWNHGRHATRAGVEWRIIRTWEAESVLIPNATAGASANTTSALGSLTAFQEIPGFIPGAHGGRLQTAATDSASLLYFLSGSVSTVSQPFWANSVDNFRTGSWETWSSGEGRKIRRTRQNQFAFFFKDDLKLSSRMTLNLGLRYENYGNLVGQGFNTGILDGGYGLFGSFRSGNNNPFDSWLTPGATYATGYGLAEPACAYGVQQSLLLPVSTCEPSLLTTRAFVGPGSDRPDTLPLYRDRNNFSPAVGFSLRFPLGIRTVLLRGGIQVTYDPSARIPAISTGAGGQLFQIDGLDETTASCSSTATCLGADTGTALTLADLPQVVPLAAAAPPTIGMSSGAGSLAVQYWGTRRAVSATAYAPNYRDPYTTNMTFSATINMTRNMNLSLSYVGTLGRRRPTAVDLNTPNVYNNPELLDALIRARAGENAPLFDEMLAGLNLSGLDATQGYGAIGTCVTPSGSFTPGPGGGAGNCPPGTYYQSGAAHLRRSPGFRTDLANGNLAAVASTLTRINDFTVLRNGCDRLARATPSNRTDLISGSETNGNTGLVRCFPDDYIIANPALDRAVYKAGWGFTNYHHLQAQLSARWFQTNFQATYVFSRLLALPRDFYRTNTAVDDPYVGVSSGAVSGFSDPRTAASRRLDYGASSLNPNHVLRITGLTELPFGEGKAFGRLTSGWSRQLTEGWRSAFVFNAQSGLPFHITAADTLLGVSSGSGAPSGLVSPDVVSTLWKSPQGHFKRNGPDGSSTYFGHPSPFALIRDPQCDRDVAGQAAGDPGGFDLSAFCALKALALKVTPGTPGAFPLSSGDPAPALIMLQNPQPGRQGTLYGQTLRQPGRFYLDVNIIKTFSRSDGKAIEFRLDAINALNHVNKADVSVNLGPSAQIAERSDAALSALSNVGRRLQFGLRLIDLF